MEKQTIVMVGDVFNGNVTFHGPFENSEHAYQWIAVNAANQQTHVFQLENN